MWGSCDGQPVHEHRYGQGRVICGSTLCSCLLSAGVKPDFEVYDQQPDAQIDYVHRTCGGAEVYFVANRRNRWEEAAGTFRVDGKAPEQWNPTRARSSGRRSTRSPTV